jgi:hypothetical protein
MLFKRSLLVIPFLTLLLVPLPTKPAAATGAAVASAVTSGLSSKKSFAWMIAQGCAIGLSASFVEIALKLYASCFSWDNEEDLDECMLDFYHAHSDYAKKVESYFFWYPEERALMYRPQVTVGHFNQYMARHKKFMLPFFLLGLGGIGLTSYWAAGGAKASV